MTRAWQMTIFEHLRHRRTISPLWC